jgi:hypothetical protein
MLLTFDSLQPMNPAEHRIRECRGYARRDAGCASSANPIVPGIYRRDGTCMENLAMAPISWTDEPDRRQAGDRLER